MSNLIVKPESILELGRVDITPFKNLVSQLSKKVWISEDMRKENKFSVLRKTQHINLRFIRGNRDHRDFYSEPLWYIWRDTLLPIMNEVIRPCSYSQPVYPKVMLARLSAGQCLSTWSNTKTGKKYTRLPPEYHAFSA